MKASKTPPLPNRKYNIIAADPPWDYDDKGGKRGASAHYETMTTEEICALDIPSIAAKDCVLFLWATTGFTPDMLKVMDAWGFTFKTKAFCWVKYTTNGKLHFGMGHWTRGNTEDCWLGIKGKPKRINGGVRQVIRSRLFAHSAKPPEYRDRIVTLMGEQSRIELFARTAVPGWDRWGLESPK